MEKPDARTIIDTHGGPAAVAKALGKKYPTVYSWYFRNAFPLHCEPLVSKRLGVPQSRLIEARIPRRMPAPPCEAS